MQNTAKAEDAMRSGQDVFPGEQCRTVAGEGMATAETGGARRVSEGGGNGAGEIVGKSAAADNGPQTYIAEPKAACSCATTEQAPSREDECSRGGAEHAASSEEECSRGETGNSSQSGREAANPCGGHAREEYGGGFAREEPQGPYGYNGMPQGTYRGQYGDPYAYNPHVRTAGGGGNPQGPYGYGGMPQGTYRGQYGEPYAHNPHVRTAGGYGNPHQGPFPGYRESAAYGQAPGSGPHSHASCDRDCGPGHPKHDANRYGQFANLVQDIANGDADASSVLSFLENMDPRFWKGALVGATAALLMSNETVKNSLVGLLSGLFGGAGKENGKKTSEPQ